MKQQQCQAAIIVHCGRKQLREPIISENTVNLTLLDGVFNLSAFDWKSHLEYYTNSCQKVLAELA
jgi:hypothetical protein